MRLSNERSASTKLFKLLLWTAVISSILILVTAGYGISSIYLKHVVEDSELDAISIGKSIVALEKHQLIHSDSQGIGRLYVERDGFSRLDETMQKTLDPLKIVKIKVFSKKGVIIYSTDHSLIGYKDPENTRLQIALSGGTSSKLQQKEQITDLRGEKHFNVDVVETYIPILNEQGMIEGSFEIYQDVSYSSFKANQMVNNSLITLTIILIVAFGLSFLVVRVAAKELSLSQGRLHKMATEDTLTGLNNRACILEAVIAEDGRYKRNSPDGGSPFSLIMVDVDNFKAINDNYGHPVGDRVLRAVASTIGSRIRECDRAGRYGGEEFLLLLPDTDLEGANLLAERIRFGVEKMALMIDQKIIPMTISLGVATIHPTEPDYKSVLKRADEGLYLAKNEGRNRVGCLASQ